MAHTDRTAGAGQVAAPQALWECRANSRSREAAGEGSWLLCIGGGLSARLPKL